LAGTGAFLATSALASLNQWYAPFILGSFGASCLIVFAYPSSPFAQPRNVIGGHVLSTFIGLITMQFLGVSWLTVALAVGLAIALMLLWRIPHPPAGSNPIIVMLGGLGWSSLLFPTLLGALALVLVALLYNNIGSKNQYPHYW
jgi:CBS-domain-containing membrane protein